MNIPFRGGGGYDIIGYRLCPCWTKQTAKYCNSVSCYLYFFPQTSVSACFIWDADLNYKAAQPVLQQCKLICVRDSVENARTESEHRVSNSINECAFSQLRCFKGGVLRTASIYT